MLSGLTYNIHLGQNLSQIVHWIHPSRSPFDLICLQEFPSTKLSFIENHFHPARYTFCYAASFKSGKEVYGELTLIDKEKVEVIDATILDLGTNIIEGQILGLGTRTSLITKLRYKKKLFLLANTHLIAYGSNKRRRDQLQHIFRKIQSRAEGDMAAIILGDMNYTSLLRRDKLFEMTKRAGFSNAYKENTHTLLSVKQQQLDYIFYKRCTIEKANVIQKPFSDHLPVQFTVSF